MPTTLITRHKHTTCTTGTETPTLPCKLPHTTVRPNQTKTSHNEIVLQGVCKAHPSWTYAASIALIDSNALTKSPLPNPKPLDAFKPALSSYPASIPLAVYKLFCIKHEQATPSKTQHPTSLPQAGALNTVPA